MPRRASASICPEQIWGEPARIDRKVFVNAATSLGGGREAYGFANWRNYDANVSIRAGENEIEYTLENTWNPSLGPASPTVFRPGDLVTDE